MADAPSRLATALADHYTLVRQLGEGGMATVYLAEDLKHKRKVALKVLRPELAAVLGGDRFVQEITTTASLQHPHILPLFDSGTAGQQDGGTAFLYYVMPYIEGETLRDKLNRETQLSVEEAVRITTEVADALDYAHRHGVIHRDIKPENILLHDGRPVVADFGIALAVSAAAGGRMTETGMSLGTPHYMSPEQATADKDISNRSDIYALGSVLYEMLAGEPPHTGSSAQAIIMKIIAETAKPVTDLRRSVPPNVAAAVGKALEKLPADRFDSAKAFADALANPGFTATTVAGGGAVMPLSRRPVLVPVLAAVAVVLAVVAAVGWLRQAPSPPPAVPTRASVTGLELGGLGKRLAISRDGRTIAAVGRADGTSHIFVRGAGDLGWRQLDHTAGASSVDFSPDGEWVAFVTLMGELWRAPVAGGPAVRLTSMSEVSAYDPQWADDGTIVFWIEPFGDLYGIPGSATPSFGGATGTSSFGDVATLLFHSDSLHPVSPYLLPNGKGILFSTQTAGDPQNGSVIIYDVAADEVREIAAPGNQPEYVEPGYVIFGHGDQVLMGVPFDIETLRATGPAVALLPALAVQQSGASQFAVSNSGTLVYDARPSPAGGDLQFVEVAMEGTVTPLPIRGTELQLPKYSPDGTRIAYELYVSTGWETRIYDFRTGADRQFTTGGGSIPIWSPSAEWVYFGRGLSVFRRPADFSASPSRVLSRDSQPNPYILDISEEERLAVVWGPAQTGDITEWTGKLFLARSVGDSMVEEDLLSQTSNGSAQISPNGRWLVHVSAESGENRVYVNTFPEFTGARAISPAYGVDPVWSPDGRTIYYRDRTQFLAVEITTEPTFTASAPRLLFERPDYLARGGDLFRNWDLHPDGTRFIMVAPAVDSTSGPDDIRIVVNWFEELKAKMQQ